MLLHELVVGKMRIASQHAIDLVHLPRAQFFLRIQAPSSSEEALAAQNLVDAWNAPGELVSGVEQRRVDVGQLRAEREQAQGVALPFSPSSDRLVAA